MNSPIASATCAGLLALLALCQDALAEQRQYTAAISSTGKVLRQSSNWLDKVEVSGQPGYFAEYTIAFKADVFARQPGYCSVAATDRSDYDDIFYGKAQLGGTPDRQQVKVQTHRVGDSRRDHDPRMSFLLLCVK
ncbi:hypothetical protein [Pseudomonas maumuensis]|uniref:Uncharacterized protein n=1 Tax=Pseudomonas maumuensis TaxID=2842354 RepID=A0ABX8NF74_9PSED|nr:hypothetical protein [Pseudomonas maumuensis]QXH55025.1 hypothetical protein KSS90_16905 [Pseudomonas maumuensis]